MPIVNLFSYFSSLKLSSDQYSAISELQSFFNSQDKVFLLKGYAGTGKTTVLSGITKALKENNIEFHLLGPTGRAALVMQNKTQVEASTIHKLIYNFDNLVEDEKSDHFQAYYALNTNAHSEDTIYFVDEASMISNAYSENEFFICGTGFLLNDLMSFCSLNNSNRKIVFIGDPAQLPPVNMNFSPALNEETIASYNINFKQSVLSQVFRQETNSDILESATQIRTNIEEENFGTFQLQTGNNDLSIIDVADFKDSYLSLAKTSRDGIDGLIVIAHSNKQTLNYNFIIRKLRYNVPGNSTVRRKEKLLVTKNSYNGAYPIFNGTIITVQDVYDSVRVEKVRFTGKNGTSHEEEIRWRDISIHLDTMNGKITLETTIVENVLNEPSRSLSDKQQVAIYVDFKNRMRKAGIDPKSLHYKEKYRSDKYFNALRVKYGYAITCHKAQGGEWSSVIIDFDTFIGDKSKTYFRWAYTALTRAKSRVLAINPNIRNPISSISFRPIELLAKPISGNWFYPNPNSLDKAFLGWQLDRLKNLCDENNILLQCQELQYMQRFSFQRNEEECTIDLGYDINFFTSTIARNHNNEDFLTLCKKNVLSSKESSEFHYQGPLDHRKLLFDNISELVNTLNIHIINIKSLQWSEMYFLNTKAKCAVIDFYFDGSNAFGTAIPKSTLGPNDELLANLISKMS
jgi:hypothetical protein